MNPEKSANGNSASSAPGSTAGAATQDCMGRLGATLVAIADAITAALLGKIGYQNVQKQEQQAMQLFGLAPDEDRLPAHYSWQELQDLSKPQSRNGRNA